MYGKIAAVLLVLGIALAGPALAQDPHEQWKDEIAALLAADGTHTPPQHGVVFAGSSSIRLWASTLASDFPGVLATDRVFGGSVISY